MFENEWTYNMYRMITENPKLEFLRVRFREEGTKYFNKGIYRGVDLANEPYNLLKLTGGDKTFEAQCQSKVNWSEIMAELNEMFPVK